MKAIEQPILEEAFNAATEGSKYPSADSYVVNKQAYRDAAIREIGWGNANLRTQFLKILTKAGVNSWARLFHSMRDSRQTELEREFPLHVVCSWLGNTEAVAKRKYLLVTDADYAKAIGTRGTKCGTIAPESGTKCGTVTASTIRKKTHKTSRKM